jgi:hypothetical protein
VSDWPAAVEYRDALQHPSRCFCNPLLQPGTVERNKLGVPRARSGAFANVYKLTTGSTNIAVRLFLHPEPEREERYGVTAAHLAHSRPRCMVNFTYEAQGIRINGDWFPVQTMDWVQGQSLGDWVRERMTQGDTAPLLDMAERWIELLGELRAAHIAHGDLQHDNVLVVGGSSPVLVDYDCLCVPALVGRHALEYGKPGYQHPRRREQDLSLELDHFSAWIIYLSLRALAADPSLYIRYVEGPQNENLLFSESDLKQPGNSALWGELLNFADPEIRDWSAALFATLPDAPIEQVPFFSVDPFAALRQACQDRDFESIDRLAAQLTGSGRTVPHELAPLIAEAPRRLACRERLESAFASRSARAVAGAYDPALVDDWPAYAPLLPRIREIVSLVGVLDELEGLLRKPGDGRRLLELWNQHRTRLQKFAEAAPLGEAVEAWRSRVGALEHFRDAVSSARSEREIAEAWQELEQVGVPADAQRWRARAEQARARADCLDRLRAVPNEASEDADRAWYQAWDEPLLRDCTEADQLRQRQADTVERLLELQTLRKAIDRADQGQGSEQAVIEAANAMPRGYKHRYHKRARVAEARLAGLRALQQVVNARPPSDVAIADAWEKLDPVIGNRLPEQVRTNCERAVRRRDCLRKLQTMDETLPVDVQDERWLADWDEGLLTGCHDATPLQPRYQLARERTDAWVALDACLNKKDLAEIARLAASPLLVDYPPLERRREAVQGLLRLAGQLGQLQAILLAREPVSGDMLQFLRDNRALVQGQRAQIETRLRDWLRSEVRLQPGVPPCVVDAQGTRARVRWTWPHLDRFTHCFVAVHPERFLQDLAEAGDEAGAFAPSDYRRADGFPVLLPTGSRERVFVTVWPVIDLGWLVVPGAPLHLGPVTAPATRPRTGSSQARRGWWG